MKDYDEEYDDSSDDDDDTSRGRLGTAVEHIDAEAFVTCCDVCYHDVRNGICDLYFQLFGDVLHMLRVASRGLLGTAVEPTCPLMPIADALVPLLGEVPR